MQKFEKIKEFLTADELLAFEILTKAGWKLLIDAQIEKAIVEGFRYQTHTIFGTYPVVLAIPDLLKHNKDLRESKKRGRPKKP